MKITKLITSIFSTCLMASMAFYFLLFTFSSPVSAQTCGALGGSYCLSAGSSCPSSTTSYPSTDCPVCCGPVCKCSSSDPNPVNICTRVDIPDCSPNQRFDTLTSEGCVGTNWIVQSKASQNTACVGNIECVAKSTSICAAPPCNPAPGSIEAVFGCITAPSQLRSYVSKPPGEGIGSFLSNLIKLIFVLVVIVLMVMLAWGALEWMLSGGDKEKIAAAKGRIINTLIGIMLFAMAIVIIQALGAFTGFKFFGGGSGSSGGGSSCENKYYWDSNVKQCIHKFATSPACTYVFDPVDGNLCPPLNCSYNTTVPVTSCPSGSTTCIGYTDNPLCAGKAPSECFPNTAPGCDFDITRSTCTCAP